MEVDVAEHNDAEMVPDLVCSDIDLNDSESGSEGWSDVEKSDGQSLTCLFCPQSFKTSYEAVTHCSKEHSLAKIKTQFNMDCYSLIKLVNYIQKHDVDPDFILNCKDPPPWESDEYLKPVKEDDPWLMVDVDEIEFVPDRSRKPANSYHCVNAEDGLVTLSEQHFSDLQQKIRLLSNEVREKDAVVQRLLNDIQQMKVSTQRIVSAGDDKLNSVEKRVANLDIRDDEWYFEGYGHIGIHHEMLSDRVRTLGYKHAMERNAGTLEGLTVLDLGCGTGILSMFAASAGAARVIGIDQSDIVYSAMDIVRENNLSDKIQLIKGRLEDTKLPVDKVNVIVSEWMGYFLLFEGMLDSLIYARDHHLAPGGLLLPNRCALHLVGVADEEYYKNTVGFWSDVYGYRMSCLRKQIIEECQAEIVDSSKVMTTPAVLLALDLNTCSYTCMDFEVTFQLEVLRDDTLTALIGYFDIFFDLPVPVTFTTGPHSTPTHWKQTVFVLEEPMEVKKGQIVPGELICRRTDKGSRSFNILLKVGNTNLMYKLK